MTEFAPLLYINTTVAEEVATEQLTVCEGLFYEGWYDDDELIYEGYLHQAGRLGSKAPKSLKRHKYTIDEKVCNYCLKTVSNLSQNMNISDVFSSLYPNGYI